MARSQHYDDHISLFPMFNILVCTMGVLIFILTTVLTISVGIGRNVVFIPENQSKMEKAPVYFEWSGKTLVHSASSDKVHLKLEKGDFKSYQEMYEYIDKQIQSSKMDAIFKDIYQHPDEKYLLILVRPSGFYNFRFIRGYIEHKNLDIGYEPIDQEWHIKMKRSDYVPEK